MLSKAKEGLNVLTDTVGSICEEHKMTTFHEVVGQ